MLRATRRLNSSGRPTIVSNGTDVIDSAPANARGEHADRVAQQIDVRITLCQHALAGAGVQSHAARPPRSATRLHDTPPQPSGGPQLGDRQEVMRADAEAKQDLTRGSVDRQPAVLHRTQSN